MLNEKLAKKDPLYDSMPNFRKCKFMCSHRKQFSGSWGLSVEDRPTVDYQGTEGNSRT